MKILRLLFILITLVACAHKNHNKKQTELADTLIIKTAILRVNGMTCEGCENTIKKMVGEIEGVKEVEASYTDSIAKVVFDTSLANIVLISETINNLGYRVVEEINP